MWLYILGAVVGLIVLFVAYVSTRPSDFRITRQATMAAPPGAVFEQVNDFHNWDAWSPWAKLDPTMKQTYEGAPAGVGAVYTWKGNSKVGQGRMTITESRPTDLIRIDLQFLKPFKANNVAEFVFQPADGKTAVTWNMIGKKNFMMKAFCVVMDMDKLVGKDFEKGLAAMKAKVEGAGTAA